MHIQHEKVDIWRTGKGMHGSCDIRNCFLNRIETECAIIALDYHTIYRLAESDSLQSCIK